MGATFNNCLLSHSALSQLIYNDNLEVIDATGMFQEILHLLQEMLNFTTVITTQPSKSYYISRGPVNHISPTKHVVKVLHKAISRPFSQQVQRVADLSLKTCSKSTV
jgi:hypothetical protein